MIVVLGSTSIDFIATSAKLPMPGETVTGSSFATASGGKGANQAMAALRAGADMRFVGAVGADDFAAGAMAELREAGADLSGVQTRGGTTGIAMILVGDDGENEIVVVPGANGLVDAAMAEETVSTMAKGDILLLQQEIPAVSATTALEIAKTCQVFTILNIAPLSADSLRLAAMADFVVANETEFAGLHGKLVEGNELSAAMMVMAEKNQQTLIVTLGSKGACAATLEGEYFAVLAPQITPVDTVGAGDTFCGYLAAGLGAGMDLKAAMARAVIAGSLACLKPGAQPAIPTAAEVDNFRP